VLNEDRIQPGCGFGEHPHWDMEIVTWVLEGALEHRDSLGVRAQVRAGDVQRMSAGTGIEHSERNAGDDVLRVFQIWIAPSVKGLAPGHEQRAIALVADALTVLVSPDGREGSLRIHQDATIYGGRLRDAVIDHALGSRRAWIQIADGGVELEVDGEAVALAAGDGAAIVDRAALRLAARGEARFLLIELA